jgi:hypothetical protein
MQRTEIIRTIDLEKSTVCLLKDDVVEVSIKDNSLVECEDMEKIFAAENELMEDRKRFVIFISPQVGTVSKEAREFSAKAETSENAIAKALIVKNVGMRMIANFFIAVNKPPVPHKIFETRLEALNWFQTLRTK